MSHADHWKLAANAIECGETPQKANFMRATHRWLPVLVLALVGVGAASRDQASAVDPGGVISGTVRSAAGPVGGAQLLIVPELGLAVGAPFVTTAADGTFAAGASPGKYTIVVSPPAPYATMDVDLAAPPGADVFTVVSGQTLSGIDIVVGSPATITGTVTAGGRPVSGVTVQSARARGSVPIGMTPPSATTGADGRYTLTGVPLGERLVSFLPPDATLASQWFDRQPTRAAATRVLTTSGAAVPAVDAALIAPGTVSGVVRTSAGTPVSGAIIQANLDGTTQFEMSGADGRFTIGGLTPGATWSLFVTPPATSDTQMATVNAAVQSAVTTEVTITLPQGARVDGSILAADGTPNTTTLLIYRACVAPAVPVTRGGGINATCSDGSPAASARYTLGQTPASITIDRLPPVPVNITIDAGTNLAIATVLATPVVGSPLACTFRLGGTSTCGARDTTPPTITCPAIPDVLLNAANVTAVAPVNDAGVISSTTAPLPATKVGPATVTFTATDAAGNRGSATCPYRVVYRFGGFSKPAHADRQIKLVVGQQLRLEWKLFDANGAPVTAPAWSSFTLTSRTCPTVAAQTTIAETSRFRDGYKVLDTGVHRFVWTAVRVSQRCATATVTLNDGTTHSVEVKVALA